MKINRNDKTPIYLQALQIIENWLLNDEFKIGDKLSSERKIASQLKIARSLLNKTLEVLVKEKVLEVKPKVGYFVKDLSPLFKKRVDKKNNIIGVIIPQFNSDYFLSFLRGINSFLKNKNILIMLAESIYDYEEEKKIIKKFILSGIDGLILFPYTDNIDKTYIQNLNKFKLPYILSHCKDTYKTNYINVDNFYGAKTAVTYLIKNGHRKIALYSSAKKETSWYTSERIKGYKKALQDAKIKFIPDYIYTGINWQENTKVDEIVKNLIKKNITAVFCITDKEAGAVKESCKKLKIKVPDKLSIMGFNQIHTISNEKFYQFTSMQIDSFTIGKELAENLYNIVYKNKKNLIHKKLKPELIENGTVKNLN